MTKNFDELNDTFNVSDEIVKAEVVKKELDNVKPSSDDVKKDSPPRIHRGHGADSNHLR